jgi:deoxyribonuclease V
MHTDIRTKFTMEFPQSTAEAKHIQLTLRRKVKIVPLKKKPRSVAGVDAAFSGNVIIAAACLFTYPELIPVEDTYAVGKVPFPYVPGLLSFREGPAIMEAVNNLSKRPDLIIFDGQGIAHPAGMGIAAHIGVLLDIPSIGCAKSRLVGDYTEPGNKKGQMADLKYHGKFIGSVLRSRNNVKPIFISPGHLIDVKDAVEAVIECLGTYRIPEPIRRADYFTKKLKREILHQ